MDVLVRPKSQQGQNVTLQQHVPGRKCTGFHAMTDNRTFLCCVLQNLQGLCLAVFTDERSHFPPELADMQIKVGVGLQAAPAVPWQPLEFSACYVLHARHAICGSIDSRPTSCWHFSLYRYTAF